MLAKVLRSLLGTRVEDRNGAFAAWQRGDLHDAETGFRRAIASGRDSADLYHGLGSVLVRQGRLDEALQALELAVEREPHTAGYQLEFGRAIAYANLGDADLRLGRTAEARRMYESYLQMQPGGGYAATVRKRLEETGSR